jgi:hypothetical protein
MDGATVKNIRRRIPAAVWTIMVAELRQFAVSPRALHVIPLLAAGILAVSMQFPPPPLMAAVVICLAALEPQFNTILYRTPGEFRAMSLLPAEQRTVVAAKNIATLILTCAIIPGCATVLLFFSMASASAADAGNAGVYALTLIFALLHSGNRRSLQYPRPISGWQTDDLIEGTGFLLTIAVFSIPYVVLTTATNLPFLCLLYAAGTAWYWWKRSIPSTATRIDQQRITLCSRT